ncbi:MAG TPA: ATP-binding protein [Stellaceae bacterium]|nr:ATP-binding protein [Stellaceae bacterium]
MIPKPLAFLRPSTGRGNTVDPGAIVAAMPIAVLVVDEANIIRSANPAAENFFHAGATVLNGTSLTDVVTPDNPICMLVDTVRSSEASVSEHAIEIDMPRLGQRLISVQAAPLPETPGSVVLSIQEMSMALKMDRQLTHRHAARSVTAMAAILAHEVKNPLSGIRGAAQLLEQTASDADQELTQLICQETDRICALVERMDMFSDAFPLEREPVNIHQVLERVGKVARSGFARHVRFVEQYDPSLPLVYGNRDRLVQVFLNLVKNAAEAVGEEGGEITLSTAYQHGIRLAVPGSDSRVHLPLVVSVQDNGGGIPPDLDEHLFDPFVTTKHNGTGLGLALVAKIIGDHGGVIEFDSQPRRTIFRVMLPMVPESEMGRGGDEL